MPDDSHSSISRVSGMVTSWTLVAGAHDPKAAPEALRAARQELLERYETVSLRYLRGAVRSLPFNREDAVEECFQNLAMRFIAGKFQGANPERGRFRNYLKTCILNVVRDYQRKLKRDHVQSLDEMGPAATPPSVSDSTAEDVTIWREELLLRALRGLGELEKQTGKPWHTVLSYRQQNPAMRSAQMAQGLGEVLGKKVTADWVRRKLMDARQKLADLIYQEAAHSLANPTPQDVEQELADLGLLEYFPSATPTADS